MGRAMRGNFRPRPAAHSDSRSKTSGGHLKTIRPKPRAQSGRTRNPFHKSMFFRQVYRIVRQIPRGKVLTYGQIATLLGVPYMARQVGWAMHGCPVGLAWQRVVGSGGKILINSQNDREGAALQRRLLELEGVHFTGKCVDMRSHQFRFKQKPKST
jgi:methylated-DNA-protein-cysteine methyltransferase-like protein